ncbi:MAG: hypothetical protein KDC10_01410 [Calditrichaeota bacterium]|nr:hypothetical protein [Calditrichota bacterium]
MRGWLCWPLLCLLSLACARENPPVEHAADERPAPVLARVGDSVFRRDRLEALLQETGRTLSREEISSLLMDWVESQIFAQESLNRHLGRTATEREELKRTRLKLLKGFLQESVLAESLLVEDWEMRNWMRDHSEELVLAEGRVRVLWYQATDSSLAEGLRSAVLMDTLKQEALGAEGVDHGRSGWISLERFQRETSGILEQLEPRELTPLLKRDERWVFYQLLSHQPAGQSLSLPDDEEEIRARVLEDLRLDRLAAFERRLVQGADWSMSLDSLLLPRESGQEFQP